MVVADDDDDVGASWRAGVQGRTGRADASHRRRRRRRRRADCVHGGTGPGRAGQAPIMSARRALRGRIFPQPRGGGGAGGGGGSDLDLTSGGAARRGGVQSVGDDSRGKRVPSLIVNHDHATSHLAI